VDLEAVLEGQGLAQGGDLRRLGAQFGAAGRVARLD